MGIEHVDSSAERMREALQERMLYLEGRIGDAIDLHAGLQKRLEHLESRHREAADKQASVDASHAHIGQLLAEYETGLHKSAPSAGDRLVNTTPGFIGRQQPGEYSVPAAETTTKA